MRPEDLPLWVKAYIATYRWRRIDPTPVARLSKPMADARVALVTSAGLVPPGEAPFDESIRQGDDSYRVIPGDLAVSDLQESHRSESFDHAPMAADRNIGLPLDALRQLAAERTIGDVAPRHLSFMGSITAPGRLINETAPAAAALLVEDRVDAALLVPM